MRRSRPSSPRAPAHRAGALRRRGARRLARRRAQGARGAAHPGRLRRRHQHGLDRRRPLRLRHVAGRARAGAHRGRLEPTPSPTAAIATCSLPAQAGRPDLRGRRSGVGLRGWKPTLPLGLIQGQKLELLLRSFTLPVRDGRGLRPAGATRSAPSRPTSRPTEAVVLGQGDLVRAMRASMSVPADLRAGRGRGQAADRRRRRRQPAGRRGAHDGRRRGDRGRHRDADLYKLDEITSAYAVNDQMLDRPDAARDRAADGLARPRRHRHRAGPGELRLGRFRQGGADHPARRGGGARGRRSGSAATRSPRRPGRPIAPASSASTAASRPSPASPSRRTPSSATRRWRS